LLPDIDIAVYWVLYWFGFALSEVHRTFTHTLLFAALFFLVSVATWKLKNKEFGRHHLKIHTMLWIIGLGILIHLGLDGILGGVVIPLYPFFSWSFGINLIGMLPAPLGNIFYPCLDAALLVLWLIYIEWKHKISDFI